MKTILFIVISNLVAAFHLVAGEPAGGYVISWEYKYDNGHMQPFTNLIEADGEVLSNIVKIIAMPYHSGLAITKDGEFKTWGNIPQMRKFLIGLKDVTDAAMSGEDVLILKRDGSLKGWGPVATRIPAEVTNVASIYMGYRPCMALRKDGTLIWWDREGRFAKITNVVSVSPSRVFSNYNLILQSDGTVLQWNDYGMPPETVTGLNQVVSVAGGPAHCLALKADGTISAWGTNSHGETNVPPGLNHIVQIAAGGFRNVGMAGHGFSLALKDDGTITGWGVMGSRNEPLIIPEGLSNVVAIATSDDDGCMAITTNRLVAERFRVEK